MAFNKLIPTTICLKAKKFMKTLLEALEDKSINTQLDSAAILLIAHTYDNYITATEMIEKDGMVITAYTSAGENLKAHPAIKIQLDAQIQLTRLLIEFGLTPKSRKDVTSNRPKEAEDKSPFGDLVDRKREVK